MRRRVAGQYLFTRAFSKTMRSMERACASGWIGEDTMVNASRARCMVKGRSIAALAEATRACTSRTGTPALGPSGGPVAAHTRAIGRTACSTASVAPPLRQVRNDRASGMMDTREAVPMASLENTYFSACISRSRHSSKRERERDQRILSLLRASVHVVRDSADGVRQSSAACARSILILYFQACAVPLQPVFSAK